MRVVVPCLYISFRATFRVLLLLCSSLCVIRVQSWRSRAGPSHARVHVPLVIAGHWPRFAATSEEFFCELRMKLHLGVGGKGLNKERPQRRLDFGLLINLGLWTLRNLTATRSYYTLLPPFVAAWPSRFHPRAFLLQIPIERTTKRVSDVFTAQWIFVPSGGNLRPEFAARLQSDEFGHIVGSNLLFRPLRQALAVRSWALCFLRILLLVRLLRP